ncbi:unnamed protein product [Lathyrus sativus]|nr:unnamed protein product [Lathyrus sativus]
MDHPPPPPPPPKSVAISSRPPRPPRRNTAPSSQVSQRQPQESSPEIKESQLLSWFQEIFPGRDLPPCLQPETNNVPPRDYSLQRMPSLPRSNAVPWHKSPERLLLRELYPHLDVLCTDLVDKPGGGLRPRRPPRSQPQAISFPSLDSQSQEEIVIAAPSPSKREPVAETVGSPPARKGGLRQCWIFVVIFRCFHNCCTSFGAFYLFYSFIYNTIAASTITHGDDCCFRSTFLDITYI